METEKSWNIYDDLKLKRIHQTTINSLFGGCPYHFVMYQKHGPVPPGIALHVGSGVHKGAEHNYRQKIGTHQDLPAKEIEEVSVTAFADRIKEQGIGITEGESAESVRSLGEKRVRALVKTYHDELAPHVIPDLVEYQFEVPVPQMGIQLVGTMDLRDNQKWVLDLKTGGKSRLQRDADTSDQLTMYAFVHELMGMGVPAGLGLDILVCTEKTLKSYRQARLTTTRTRAHYNQLLRKVDVVLQIIRAGVYPPNTQWWGCSPRFCGYFDRCEFPYRR